MKVGRKAIQLQLKSVMNCLQCNASFTPKKKGRFCGSACGKRFYYLANKQHLDAYRSEWAQKNPKKQVDYVKKSREAKPEKYRQLKSDAQLIRERRISQSLHRFTEEQWQKLLISTENKCLCCGKMDIPLGPDHVLPICMGGSDGIDNIQPLCWPCNKAKHARHIDYRKAA